MIRLASLSLLLLVSSWPALAQAQRANSVAPGRYHCVFFVNAALTTVPGFTIHRDGAYQHDDGSKGRYVFDAAQSLITFQGGSLNSQAGRVEVAGQRSIIRLYNERRSRTVMDCDAPR